MPVSCVRKSNTMKEMKENGGPDWDPYDKS